MLDLNPHKVKTAADVAALNSDVHSVVSPSNFARMMKCPASVYESMMTPQKPSSPAAQRGTLLHDRIVQMWEKPGSKAWERDLEPKEVQWILTAKDRLEEILHRHRHDDVTIIMERRGSMAQWGLPEIFGTMDVFAKVKRSENEVIVYVLDWKTGSGTPVYTIINQDINIPLYERVNPQLMGYAAMCFGPNLNTQMKVTFRLGIEQMPLGYSELVILDRDEVQGWIALFKSCLDKVHHDPPIYNPGQYQCEWCPARLTCRDRREFIDGHNRRLFETATALREKQPVQLEELAETLRSAKIVKKYISSVEKHALSMQLNGVLVPGYKAVRGRGKRDWKDAQKAAAYLSTILDIEQIYPAKLISPAQAESLNRTLKKNDDFKDLVNKVPGKPQLVPETDKREAINVQDTASRFEAS